VKGLYTQESYFFATVKRVFQANHRKFTQYRGSGIFPDRAPINGWIWDLVWLKNIRSTRGENKKTFKVTIANTDITVMKASMDITYISVSASYINTGVRARDLGKFYDLPT
jgi:hypothetical protein